MRTILIFVAMTFLLTYQASGQVMCAEVFQKAESVDFMDLIEAGSLREFEQIKQDILHSKKQSEVNEATHHLVVEANRVMDQVMDLIITVNFAQLPRAMKAERAHLAEMIIEHLQKSFGIGDQAMSAAIGNRLNREVADLQAQQEAAANRRAIGFGRDQSSESFHAEKAEKQQIGFGNQQRSERSEEVTDSVPTGFQVKKQNEVEETIRRLVEFEESLSPEAQSHIGFVPIRSSGNASSAAREPIGFRRTEQVSERITEEGSHKILFDVETGLFELVRATHN